MATGRARSLRVNLVSAAASNMAVQLVELLPGLDRQAASQLMCDSLWQLSQASSVAEGVAVGWLTPGRRGFAASCGVRVTGGIMVAKLLKAAESAVSSACCTTIKMVPGVTKQGPFGSSGDICA